ncbi:hypothetical protein K493DRAFT_312429 [Basidiobolus meristosporus CBS 931.73]|uniref:Tetraspanin n=1 Tax=Basidiobolus meristosporus CBS 931.73 TaxID=1314790 RepID=A0A1Y1YV76_9FUNG|nr:hypothetical protein K493DRAFT_312429 [Basidiobolus meristosporus CBS 931.73]|eukprot:ORY01475.1 hypothetical protein K493DRAFT_312429 [Basidiobolus meristosporus CBS 931.73]
MKFTLFLCIALFVATGGVLGGFGYYFYITPLKRRMIVITTEMIYAGLALGGFIVLTGLIGLLGFLSPLKRRGLLTFFIWLITVVLFAQLALGGLMWFNSLNIRGSYAEKWRSWSPTLRAVFQETDRCCGYYSEIDSPALSPLCEMQLTGLPGCVDAIHVFTQNYLQHTYTILFSFTAIDFITILATLVVIQASKDQKRHEVSKRYSQISELTQISRLNLAYLQNLKEELKSIHYV